MDNELKVDVYFQRTKFDSLSGCYSGVTIDKAIKLVTAFLQKKENSKSKFYIGINRSLNNE